MNHALSDSIVAALTLSALEIDLDDDQLRLAGDEPPQIDSAEPDPDDGKEVRVPLERW